MAIYYQFFQPCFLPAYYFTTFLIVGLILNFPLILRYFVKIIECELLKYIHLTGLN